jgi:hypothetical protein
MGFFVVGKPYWLVHTIWMQNKDYMFPFFSMLHSFLRISLAKVPMYMFFGNIFQIAYGKL